MIPAVSIAPGVMVNPTVRLLRPLGAGGMGAVWVAEHLALQTHVVVKFMSPELAKDQANVQRFAREAAAASQVKSPHVVQTFDHGVSPDGLPFIVMELLEGHDLAHHVLSRGRLPPEEVATIVTQTCKALSKAHEKGIIHRDIKPDNIFLVHGDELFVKLLDFGIAKATGALSSHTGTGAMIGTPYYMSPEQIVGSHALDFRTDIWAMGIVAFEALTGQKPFMDDTIGGLAVKLHSGQLPLPSSINPHLPPAIDVWFQRACARDPEARFPSVKELATSLAAAVGHASIAMPAPVLPPHVAGGPTQNPSGGWGATPPPSNRSAGQGHAPPPPPPPPPQHQGSYAQHGQYPSYPQQPSFPAPGTHMASTSTPAPLERKSSKAPLILALLLLLLLGGAGGVFFMLRSSDDAEQPASAGSAEEPTSADAPKKKKKKKAVEEEPAPEPTPAPTPTPTPEAAAKKPPPPATTAAPPLPPPVKPSTTTTATATAPKPPVKKGNDDDIK